MYNSTSSNFYFYMQFYCKSIFTHSEMRIKVRDTLHCRRFRQPIKRVKHFVVVEGVRREKLRKWEVPTEREMNQNWKERGLANSPPYGKYHSKIMKTSLLENDKRSILI